GRLVEDRKPGPRHERAGKKEAALHAAGVPGDLVVDALPAVRDLEGALVEARAKLEVLAAREPLVGPGVLRKVGDDAAHVHRVIHDIVAEDEGLAFGRLEEGGEDADRRALAGAARAA